MFAKGQKDRGWIPNRLIPKIQKIVLDATLFNPTVQIKDKVVESREWSSALPYTTV